jgi:hypothetical protein
LDSDPDGVRYVFLDTDLDADCHGYGHMDACSVQYADFHSYGNIYGHIHRQFNTDGGQYFNSCIHLDSDIGLDTNIHCFVHAYVDSNLDSNRDLHRHGDFATNGYGDQHKHLD